MENLTLETNGAVAIITMTHTTMKSGFLDDMLAVLKQMEDMQDIRAIILKNDGRFFCAGGDLSAGTKRDAAEFQKFIHRHACLSKALATLPKPVIALVNGAAAGGGANLALSCDFVFASEKAVFKQAFIDLNYIPDTGGLWNLIRLAGPMRAKELSLTGRKITAEEACRYGLITEVVPSDQLLGHGLRFAQTLAEKPPAATAYIKELCYRMPELTHAAYMQYEASVMALLWGTEDHKEGVQAFLDKRKPVFTGR